MVIPLVDQKLIRVFYYGFIIWFEFNHTDITGTHSDEENILMAQSKIKQP